MKPVTRDELDADQKGCPKCGHPWTAHVGDGYQGVNWCVWSKPGDWWDDPCSCDAHLDLLDPQ